MPMVLVEISGLKTRLGRASYSISPEVILKVVGARLTSFVDESFRTRGRGKWEPIAPLTRIIRGSAPPLQKSPKYKQSFVVSTDNKTYVEIGSDHPAAKFHEYGTGIWGSRGSTYTIRVVNARTLAAKLLGGGYLFFGPAVEHTGVPARPVLPTRDEVNKILPPVIEAMIQRVTGGAA